MMTTGKKEDNDIELLLPWHAAGTLSRREAQAIDEAIGADPELARRYALVREELGETIGLNESLGAPSARIMNDLLAKIDAEPRRRSSITAGLGARVSEFFGSLAPRTIAFASAAAAIAILLQASVIGTIVFKQQPGIRYETASAPGASQMAGAFVLMRFAPQATQDDVTKFLAANKLSIVAGPMNGGLYKVKVASEPLSQAEIASRIQALQTDKTVSFIAITQ